VPSGMLSSMADPRNRVNAPVSRGGRSLGSTCRRVDVADRRGPRTPCRRPQSKQVPPWRSRSLMAPIDFAGIGGCTASAAPQREQLAILIELEHRRRRDAAIRSGRRHGRAPQTVALLQRTRPVQHPDMIVAVGKVGSYWNFGTWTCGCDCPKTTLLPNIHVVPRAKPSAANTCFRFITALLSGSRGHVGPLRIRPIALGSQAGDDQSRRVMSAVHYRLVPCERQTRHSSAGAAGRPALGMCPDGRLLISP
jgi:hypothetical protein